MAYSLVPDANNTVGSDLTAMYDNFAALESAQIVDSGSTADGDYIRYENGWQICFFVKSGFTPDNQITGIGQTQSEGFWYFPFNFVNANVFLGAGGTSDWGAGTSLASSFSPKFRLRNVSASRCVAIGDFEGWSFGGNVGSCIFAIGRWK